MIMILLNQIIWWKANLMVNKRYKCRALLSHAIGLIIGLTSGVLFYYLSKPTCKTKKLKCKVKKAFKTIENKIDL